MKDDYIRREDMLDAVEKLDIIPSVDGMGIPTDTEDFRVQFLGTVLKVEPADVVPVVYGEWIRSGVEGHVICNKCGYEANYTIIERQDKTGKWVSKFGRDIKTNFCPNCGAKMDG